MTTPESTSAARSPRRRAPPPRRSSSPTSGRDGSPPTGSRAAPRSGRTPRWRWPSARSATATATARPDSARIPATVLQIVERVMREGDARHGSGGADLEADDALALLRAWLYSMELDVDEHKLLLPAPGRRADPRRSRSPGPPRPRAQAGRRGARHRRGASNAALRMRGRAALALFDACMPAIPYAAAAAFLGREKAKLTRSDGDRPRVALVVDGIGGMHGVTHAIQQIRARGVRGFDVEVIGTDADVDRRLSAVAEIDIPFYPGLQIGVPTVPAIVEALAEGRYDIVHVCSPGPGGHRGLAARPRARAPARRQLPHRARRLRGTAHRPAPVRGAGQLGPGPLLPRLRRGALTQPGQRPAAGRAGNRFRPDPALGSRRRPAPLRSRSP